MPLPISLNGVRKQAERTAQKAQTTETQNKHVANLLRELVESRLNVLQPNEDESPERTHFSWTTAYDSILRLLELCEEERQHLEKAHQIASDEFPRTHAHAALKLCLKGIEEQCEAISTVVKRIRDARLLLQRIEKVAPTIRRLPDVRSDIIKADNNLLRRKHKWKKVKTLLQEPQEDLADADDEDEKADIEKDIENSEQESKDAKMAYRKAQLHLDGLQTQVMQVMQFGVSDVIGDDSRLKKIVQDYLDPDVPVLAVSFDSFIDKPKLLSSSSNARHALFLARMEEEAIDTNGGSATGAPVRDVVMKRFSLASSQDKNRVRHEIRLLNRLQPHENIIHVDGVFFEQEGSTLNAFVVMPYFHDGDLLQWKRHMDRCHLPISPSIWERIWRQMLLAISHVHSSKIVHCDIKPHNIFVRDEQLDFNLSNNVRSMTRRAPRVVLGDFDVSIDMKTRTLDPTQTMQLHPRGSSNSNSGDSGNGGGGGTLSFMAPEIFHEGKSATFSSDMYSFGKTVEMVMGVETLSSIPSLHELVNRCLSQVASKRPSAHEALNHDYFLHSTLYDEEQAMKHSDQLKERERSLDQKEQQLKQMTQEQKRRERGLHKVERKQSVTNNSSMQAAAQFVPKQDATPETDAVSSAPSSGHCSIGALRKTITELCSLNDIFSNRATKPLNELIDALDVIETSVAGTSALRRCALLYFTWLLAEEGWMSDARQVLKEVDDIVFDDDNEDNLIESLARGVLAAQRKQRDDAIGHLQQFTSFMNGVSDDDKALHSFEREHAHEWLVRLGAIKPPMQLPRRVKLPVPDLKLELQSTRIPQVQNETQNARNNRNNNNNNNDKTAMDELDELIGLKRVKKLVSNLRDNVSIEQEMKKHDPQYKDKDLTLNMLFVGNPGTGKTTVARLVARILHEVGFLDSDKFTETTGAELGRMMDSDRKKFMDNSRRGVLFIDEAYQLNPKESSGGAESMNDILRIAEEWRKDTVIILAGYREDMQKLIEYNSSSGLPSRFPKEIPFEDYNQMELRQILVKMLLDKRLKVEDPVMLDVLSRRLAASSGSRGFGNARTVRALVEKCSVEKNNRIATLRDNDVHVAGAELFVLSKEDMLGHGELPSQSNVMKTLHSMVGLNRIKKDLSSLLQVVKNNRRREEQGKPLQNISLHRLFFGNPGTGKTTVAQLYAQILKELGMLSKGELLVCTPADFVGSVLGESEKKTKALIASARGKVLFVDEAYGLHPKNDPYRKAAIDTIVSEIQGTPGEDIALLMAGYEEQMLEMLREANPGLARRLQVESAFHFGDYTDNELEVILCRRCLRDGLSIRRTEARQVIKCYISRLRCKPNFGNAGEINNALNVAKQRFSEREVNAVSASNDDGDTEVDVDGDELLAEDFMPDDSNNGKESSDQLLSKLVGLEDLKSLIESMRALVAQARSDGKDPADKVSGMMNFVFTGPPGCGKTTAARLMGKVLNEMGVLPSDTVMEKSATELQTGYIGQAGPQTCKVLSSALGGVLFIDEAYRLLPSNGSYNREIVDELVQAITEPKYRGKLAVILAGYDKDIAQLIRSNQGLESRFASKVQFHHMKPEYATKFFLRLCADEDLKLSSAVTSGDALHRHFETALREMPNWSNGRDVETLFRRSYQNRAMRLQLVRRRNVNDGQEKLDTGDNVDGDERLIMSDIDKAFASLMRARLETAKFAEQSQSAETPSAGLVFQQQKPMNDVPPEDNIIMDITVEQAKEVRPDVQFEAIDDDDDDEGNNDGSNQEQAMDNASDDATEKDLLVDIEHACIDSDVSLDDLLDHLDEHNELPSEVLERLADHRGKPSLAMQSAVRRQIAELHRRFEEIRRKREEERRRQEELRKQKEEELRQARLKAERDAREKARLEQLEREAEMRRRRRVMVCGFCGREGCPVGPNHRPPYVFYREKY